MKKMKINKDYASTHNTSAVSRSKIDYLVIHYTAGLKSYAGKGKETCKMFGSSDREASADFVVDDGDIIWQYNPDVFKRRTWHCGGGIQGSNGHKYYGKCTNSNSIGIEMSSDKMKVEYKNGKAQLWSSDDDWYIHPDVWESAVACAAIMLNKYKIPFSNMIRHYDVTGKECPSFMCGSKKNDYYKNKKGDDVWEAFKKDVKEALDEIQGKSTVKTTSATTVASTVKKDTTSADYKRFINSLKGYYNDLYKLKLVQNNLYDEGLKNAITKHNITKDSPEILVKHMQYWLARKGYVGKDGKKLTVDGKWGANTTYAVKAMQKKLKLTQDGIIGTGTIAAFLKTL